MSDGSGIKTWITDFGELVATDKLVTYIKYHTELSCVLDALNRFIIICQEEDVHPQDILDYMEREMK